ncbi:MAG TPA: cytochrome c nitrite reductase small subunit [Phycisphaerales bacterium]|mgnify:CR=1 FL=1|nr:cytochrome c nitrite reductase small subunit [Phycisphaerales bacterium]
MVGKILTLLALPGLPRFWQVAVYGLAGIAAGMGVVVVRISNAVSYLSDSPETCINCHVMTDAYASWQRGSHGRETTCNDCHVPHDNILAKTAFKAMDGARHSYVFTMRKEPQVLTLSKGAVPVVQNNCVRCHANQFQMIRLFDTQQRTCWSCHQNIHGDIHSLSASPRPLRPALPKAGIDIRKSGD